jgi:hypothetical protein
MGSFSPTSAYVPCLSVAALAGASGSLAVLSALVAAIDFTLSRRVSQAKPGGFPHAAVPVPGSLIATRREYRIEAMR